MYAAAWAHTAPGRARAPASASSRHGPAGRRPPAPSGAPASRHARGGDGPDPRLAFGAGAATALGLVALVRRRDAADSGPSPEISHDPGTARRRAAR